MSDGAPSLSWSVASATGWVVATRIVLRLINLATLLVLARLLTPDDFGVAATAMSVLLIAEGVTELQFGAALIRRREIAAHHWDATFTLNLLRGLAVAAALALLAGPIAALLERPDAAGALAAIGAVPLLRGLSSPKFILFERGLSLRQDFTISTIRQLVTVATSIGVATVRPDYWALVAASIVGAAAGAALSHRMLPYRPRLGLRGASELFAFSGWLMGGRAIGALNDQADKFMLLARLDAAAVGQYRIGASIVSILTLELIKPLTRTLFPAFSSIQDDAPRIRRAYLNAQQVILMIGLPVGFGLPFIAEPLIALAAGPQWTQAALVAQYIAPVMAVQMLTAGIESVIMAAGDTRRLFMRTVLATCIRFPTLLAGVMLGGFEGLLVARVFTGLTQVVINLALLRRVIGLPVRTAVTRNGRIWASAGLMVAALWLGPPPDDAGHVLSILWSVGLGGAVYVAAVVGLWLLAGRPAGAETRMLGVAREGWRRGRVVIGRRLGA